MPFSGLVRASAASLDPTFSNNFWKRGYHPRGTVRFVSKEMYSRRKYPQTSRKGPLELVVIEDIAESWALEEAAKGCSASWKNWIKLGVDFVIHVAGPFHLLATDVGRNIIRRLLKESRKHCSWRVGQRLWRNLWSRFCGTIPRSHPDYRPWTDSRGPWPGHVYSHYLSKGLYT